MNKIQVFEKVINDNKSAMLQIECLYNMSCHNNYEYLNDEQKEKLLGVIYCHYLKDETKTDLAVFSDIIMDNYIDILDYLKYQEHRAIDEIIYNNL